MSEKAETRVQIDVEEIERRLFVDPAILAQIMRDYGINTPPIDAHEFASAVLEQLEQEPALRPLEQTISNAGVFRAAAKAIGSNNRKWATFLKAERRLSDLLSGYDPVRTRLAFERGELSLGQLKTCMPGQSSGNDARAILRWAKLLTEVEHYYGFIQDLGTAFRRLSKERYGEPPNDADLMLCLVGYLGHPPSRWEGLRYLGARSQGIVHADQDEVPGMKYALTSEFLRNLRWNGFKPDRHVQRLFDRWFPARSAIVQGKVQRLKSLIERNTKDLNTFLTYSLVGATVTPDGVPLSQADNFVWLLGAYVEKKGREATQNYLIDMLSDGRHARRAR